MFVFCKLFCRNPLFSPSTDATLTPLLLLLFKLDDAVEMLAVDLVSNFDVDDIPFDVRVGRCVVVILVNVYGGKSFRINESIIRAM